MMSSMSLGRVPMSDIPINDYGILAHQAFDSDGNVFEILHLNADKLPKLIEGNDLAVDIPPNIIPDLKQKKDT